MIWHITKRELYNNINSLRFALITLLILPLMIINAIGYLGKHELQMQTYGINVARSHSRMRYFNNNLYNLVLRGAGKLYKKPSPLTFCAGQEDAFLSEYVESSNRGIWSYTWHSLNEHGEVSFNYSARGIWRMQYPQSNPNLWNILPDYTNVDWRNVISLVLSLVAILVTFDAISSEQARGTLRLMLSNSVPRDTVLLGKFFGALISISIPFLIAVLINISLLYASGGVRLGASEWGRLGGILLIAIIYISIFLALGLLVSSRVSQSSISLMILTLIWAVWVVFMPSTLGYIVSGLKPPMTIDEFHTRRKDLRQNLDEQYKARGLFKEAPSRDIPATPATLLWGEYITEEAQSDENLNEEHLKTQVDQLKFAKSVARISPAAIVGTALESLAGTGFPRHLQFLGQVRRYASEFREFLIATDHLDPESPHAPFIKEGMSEKPVNFDTIPKFEDRIRFSESFNASVVDIFLLLLFFVVLFAGAFLSFLRVDIR